MRKGQKIKLLTNVGKLKKNETVTVTGVDQALRMAFIKNDKGVSEGVSNTFSNYQLIGDSVKDKELKFKEGSLKVGQTFKTGNAKGKILKLQWDPKFGYDVLYYSEKSRQNVWTGAESNFTLDSNEKLKSYNIKNHNTGKTYRVKAKSFNDAKEKYEKFIADGNSFTYKGHVIIKSSHGWKVKIGNKIIEFATDKEAKEYIDLHKDSLTEDATLTDFKQLKQYIMQDDMRIYNETQTSFSYRDYHSKENSGTMKLENGLLVAYDVNNKKVNSWKSFAEYKSETMFDSLTEDANLIGKTVKYKNMTVKVLRKLTEQEKQKRAHLNNPDAGDYYEVEATSKALGTDKFIVWEARLRDSLTEDANLAQLEIKNLFYEEETDADEIKYLGFNNDRKISFYEYRGEYIAFFDLENRAEKISKDQVQKILKRNIIEVSEKEEDDLYGEGNPGIAATVRTKDSDSITLSQFNPKALVNSTIQKRMNLHNYVKLKNGDKYFIAVYKDFISVVRIKESGDQKRVVDENYKEPQDAVVILEKIKKQLEKGGYN